MNVKQHQINDIDDFTYLCDVESRVGGGSAHQTRKNIMGMISEFKDFAMKGSMLDMAVGIIMGGAFGTVIKSLIEDVIMPVVGHFSGGLDFSNMKIVLTPAQTDASGAIIEGTGAAIGYGSFINAVIAFAILAYVLFIMIKGMNKAKKAEEEAPAAPPANEVLLAEIRDLLAKS